MHERHKTLITFLLLELHTFNLLRNVNKITLVIKGQFVVISYCVKGIA